MHQTAEEAIAPYAKLYASSVGGLVSVTLVEQDLLMVLQESTPSEEPAPEGDSPNPDTSSSGAARPAKALVGTIAAALVPLMLVWRVY
eukprot:scaffold4013_cov429-Prasinococcus_capsulatus_cf.AAC.5